MSKKQEFLQKLQNLLEEYPDVYIQTEYVDSDEAITAIRMGKDRIYSTLCAIDENSPLVN